jgi:hypothetical protein
VDWTLPLPGSPGNNGTSSIQTPSGSVLFSGKPTAAPQTASLNLAAGQYELLTNSSYNLIPVMGPCCDGSSSLAVTFPAPTPVPLPGSVWLLGSALLLTLGAAMHRRQCLPPSEALAGGMA